MGKKDKKDTPRLGKQPPRYRFFLNLVFRFSLARREDKKAKASAQGHIVDKSTGSKRSL